MDPTQKNGFEDANPAVGMGGVLGGGVLGGQAVVPGVQPVVSDTQYAISGAQPMMSGGQAMNATPMNLGIPLSSGDGDIVLNGGAKKKSKKWWIVGASIGALLLCTMGSVLLFTSFQDNSRKEIEIAWDGYYDYLMYGGSNQLDGADDLTVETWYPAVIGTLAAQDEEDEGSVQYYGSLNERLDTFSRLSSQKIDGVLVYDAIFKAFYDYNMINNLKKAVIDEYNNGGMDGAISYISSINDSLTMDDSFVDGLYNNLKVYLQAFLSVVDYYDENDCDYIEANYVRCPKIDSSSETMTELEMLYRRRNNLNNYYDNFYENYFFEYTRLMDKRIKERQ